MTELRALAYVSWGLWVADCPRPDCGGAEHYGHAPKTGFVGGLTPAGFRCAECGLVCPSEWPDNAEDIWLVLQQRPLRKKRNWFRHETVEELVLENMQHGIMPRGIETGVHFLDGRLADRSAIAATPGRFAIAGGA